jgi:hypothetical protein
MSDTTTAAEQARVAAETEASREIAATAAPDNPNPPAPEAAPHPDPLPASGEREIRDDGPRPLERVTTFDRGRADIAARFKEKRAGQGGQVDFHGDMRDPSQTYGPYAGQGAPPAPEAPSAPTEAAATEQAGAETTAPAPAPEQPALTKLKVHGVEMYLPQDQVVAEAQKSLAAGNLLESAKEVLSGARSQMSDAGDQMSDQQPTSGIRHLSSESDPYLALAQTLQLESADAAGTKLKQTIESETAKARQEAAREAARHVRVENELAVSQRALAAFEETHPDLAADEFARDSITTQVQREINADLAAAVSQGILKELPKSQDERNGLHTQLRAFGAPVRSIGDIFAAAGTKYAAWRGAAPPAAKSEIGSQKSEGASSTSDFRLPTSPAAAPRVELTTARQERRAQIPTQPTSGTAPPRAAAPAPELTTAQRRNAAVMAMRKARGQIVA